MRALLRRFLREQIKIHPPVAIAAIVAEPMQGTAGNVIPPDDWLPAVKSVAKDHGAMLIADEMITGFGRTGRMWGIEHSGVAADIVTIGKGRARGYPVSGVLMSEHSASAEPFCQNQRLVVELRRKSPGGGGCRPNDQDDSPGKTPQNSRRVGAILLARLLQFKEKYEFVGDVRGRGLLIGLDLVSDAKNRIAMSRR